MVADRRLERIEDSIERRFPAPLPETRDIRALAGDWKKHWNTRLGKGTQAQFVDARERYVKPKTLGERP